MRLDPTVVKCPLPPPPQKKKKKRMRIPPTRTLSLKGVYDGEGGVRKETTEPVLIDQSFVLLLGLAHPQLLADTSTGQVVYKGYGEAIQAILRDEGPRGFYKGISASYWGCSEGCLYFVIYERLKRFAPASYLIHQSLVDLMEDAL